MNTNRLIVTLIILLLAVSLAACKRNLPAPETATPVAPQPDDQSTSAADIATTIAENLTQTAMAQITPGAPGEVTEEPGGPTDEAPPVVTDTPMVQTPTPTPPIRPIPEITVPQNYTLNRGEFPFCIARRFNVDPGELLRLNGLSSGSVFYAGMSLNIPQTGKAFPGNRALRAHPTTYTVRSGDSIYSIACYFGDVAPEQIAAANGLSEPYRLTPGQNLNIP
jgi:LysM repeat protein